MSPTRFRAPLIALIVALTTVIALPALPTLPVLATAPAHATSAKPALTDPHPCADAQGFTCSTLTVPLDHSGKTPGELKLQVATGDNADAPKGVLLLLTGGPGQPSVPFVTALAARLPEVAADYRWVTIDLRGTGANALKCPALQAESVTSDVAPATPAAVRECSRIIGSERAFYRTDDTVADLELLRRALGVRQMTLNGLSYGSRTAAHYAFARPANVRKMVLDSVIPFADPERDDALSLVSMRAHRRVLREACAQVEGCTWDPTEDLAWLVRQRGDGVRLLDLTVVAGFLDPTYSGVIHAMHEARAGDPADLDRMLADMAAAQPQPYEMFSWGLQIATHCADARQPWGDSSTAPHRRQAALERRIERLRPHETYPFDRATAAGVGFVQRCLHWPASRPGSQPPAWSRIPVPTLLLVGDRDLSTPVEWAQEVAARAPQGKLVVVPNTPHLVQVMEPGRTGRDAISAFLTQD
ncbi:esterase [Spongiactinospora gelatinilytica]|uniref:Esterase n=1 Tax=Spongiactinospora gelatinilytica TaxID=2666298 RepID=A0A2W2G8P6_9ACTN|nr:alpha/beta hydrolase [Spongiactinospora gelatinilytica]PZG44222.1 esterase [Spongiactinospora gelatinilytica]